MVLGSVSYKLLFRAISQAEFELKEQANQAGIEQ